MNTLNLAENLLRLRRDKGLTQEVLAEFMGVTKASVSKWETRQSLPDILLLPQLAAFFGVTVDELLGYEAQLSREQIQKHYGELAAAFTCHPFGEVMAQARALVRRYYSCAPFLVQICILWLNHFMLAETPEQGRAVLEETAALCDHITSSCRASGPASDAAALKAMALLQLGRAREIIPALEEEADPYRLARQNDALLIQAYQAAGEGEKALDRSQLLLYLSLLSLVGACIQYLAVNPGDAATCQETIRRGEGLIDLYHLQELHPNLAAQLYYQAAVCYFTQGEPARGLARLQAYARTLRFLFQGDHFRLRTDGYFNRLERWFEQLGLGPTPPRDKAIARNSARQSLQHPAFAALNGTADLKQILEIIQEGENENA